MGSVKQLLLAAACLLAVQLVASQRRLPTPFRNASLPCHRLPMNVRPTSYDLHLKFPSFDSHVYGGRVDIAVEFLKSKTGVPAVRDMQKVRCEEQYDENTIVLHADKRINIKNIKVSSETNLETGHGRRELKITDLTRDEVNQMIAIKLEDGIHSSTGKVSITFEGLMGEDERGVYVSIYDDGKRIFKHIVSQLQPTGARTVFPCFDEPQFRTPFSVRVSHPKDLTAYGNTEVQQVSKVRGLSSSLFSVTPPMPVHMVAFIIGEFDEPLEVVSTSSSNKARKIRVITAPGKRETGHFALEVAQKSLEWFEKYIDYEFPLDKLDVIAIADLERDNTEGWGLAFVRDTLLWIDDETNLETRITTAENIAHVVVHQWFGNLISVNWWSDLWITEGVAAQFSFNIVRDLYENLQSQFFARFTKLSTILNADATVLLHPLSIPEEDLLTGDQIYEVFCGLEFMKSASMAQMVEETVGSLEYQRNLRELIKEHAFKTIKFGDYQRALLKDERSIKSGLPFLLNSFPKVNGVPLVNCGMVRHHGNLKEMRIDLELIDEARNAGHRVPRPEVSVKVGSAVRVGGSSSFSVHNKIININDYGHLNSLWLPHWFDLDYQNGQNLVKIDNNPSIATYYRTRYSEELYESLQGAIKNQLMSPMDRLQIIDDANSLVGVGLISLQRFRSLLESYAEERDPAIIEAILVATHTYLDISGDLIYPLQSSKAIYYVFERYGFEVTGHEDAMLQRARRVILTSLVYQGDERVIAAALEAFDRADGKVALFLREPVYTAVVMSGSPERVNKLLDHLFVTKSYEEQIRLLTALTMTKYNQALIKDEVVLMKIRSWLELSGLKKKTMEWFLINNIRASLGQ